jgi:hypothetical protein
MTVAEAIKLMKKSPTQCLEASEAEKFCEAYDMAIRSLEAWEKIVEELADMEKEFEYRHDCPRADTLKYALSIIDKHLKGVSE